MIVSIRGTNGSGKSTLVRRIMEMYETRVMVKYPPEFGSKKRPMGYICMKGCERLFVPGHYEIANGGVDTLPTLNIAYELAVHHHELGAKVVLEGKNLSDGPERVLKIHRAGIEVRSLLLDLPLDQCVQAVRTRGHSISERTIERLHLKCRRDHERLLQAGVECYKTADREAALEKVKAWLEI